MTAPRRMLAVPASALLAAAVLSGCGSSGGSPAATAADKPCQHTSPLVNGVTPQGTNLCLGVAATVALQSHKPAATATVRIATTTVTKAPAADLAQIAAKIPQDVSAAKNDLYYVRAEVTVVATSSAADFVGKYPLENSYGLRTDDGKASAGYVGVSTDACDGNGGSFTTGRPGEVVRVCSLEFVAKGAKPVTVSYADPFGDESFLHDPVRWQAG